MLFPPLAKGRNKEGIIAVGFRNVVWRFRMLNAADRLQPHPRIDFLLRQHAGLRPEALHDDAHERPDGEEARRLHGEAAVVALAGDRFVAGPASKIRFRGEADIR